MDKFVQCDGSQTISEKSGSIGKPSSLHKVCLNSCTWYWPSQQTLAMLFLVKNLCYLPKLPWLSFIIWLRSWSAQPPDTPLWNWNNRQIHRIGKSFSLNYGAKHNCLIWNFVEYCYLLWCKNVVELMLIVVTLKDVYLSENQSKHSLQRVSH